MIWVVIDLASANDTEPSFMNFSVSFLKSFSSEVIPIIVCSLSSGAGVQSLAILPVSSFKLEIVAEG